MTKEVALNLWFSHGKVIMPNNDSELHLGGGGGEGGFHACLGCCEYY